MTDDDDDPRGKIRLLATRLGEEAAKQGLTLLGFSYHPNLTGDGPDTVQAVYAVEGELAPDPTDATVDPEQAGFDAAFEEFLTGQAEADKQAEREAVQALHADKLKNARAAAERRLREGEGFLEGGADDS